MDKSPGNEDPSKRESGVTPVVFLHAYPLNGSMWREQRRLLAGRPTLAPDLPGFGDQRPGPQSLDGFADRVVSAMDQAGLERAIIVGLSMGGYIAFRLWNRRRERVAGFVLADTRAGADVPQAAERRADQARRARAEGVGWLPDAMLDGVLGETTRRERPEVVEEVRGMMLWADPEGVARALLAMRERPDSTPLLSTIDVPTLVLVGEEDTLTGVEEARTIAEGVPNAELRLIPAAGHLSNLENPRAFGVALTDFVGRFD